MPLLEIEKVSGCTEVEALQALHAQYGQFLDAEFPTTLEKDHQLLAALAPDGCERQCLAIRYRISVKVIIQQHRQVLDALIQAVQQQEIPRIAMGRVVAFKLHPAALRTVRHYLESMRRAEDLHIRSV